MIVSKINPFNEKYLIFEYGPNTVFCTTETPSDDDCLVEFVENNRQFEILSSNTWLNVIENHAFTIYAIRYETEDDFMMLKLSV